MTEAQFPLHRIAAPDVCACKKGAECTSVGKCPNGSWGDLCEGEKRPIPAGCGYGIATGKRSGFFVVDLDVKKNVDGISAFVDLAAGRDIPLTHTTLTGNGKGNHLRFLLPEGFEIRNSQGALGPGIDIRGEGGYIVGPGSPHASGGMYTVTQNVPIAAAPAWLLELLRNPPKKAHREPHPVNAAPPTGAPSGAPSTRAAAAAMLRAAWPKTGRHEAQLALAGALVRGGWTDSDAVAFLVEVAGEPSKRADTVRDTRARHEAGETFTGLKTLEEHVGKDVVSAARKLLGLEDLDFAAMASEAFGGAAPPAAAPVSGDSPEPDPLAAVGPRKKVKMDRQGIVYILSQSPTWRGVFRMNLLTRRHTAVRPPFAMRMENDGPLSDGDVGKIQTWFANPPGGASVDGESVGYSVKDSDVRSAISQICEEKGRGYNPFIEYLDALPPSSGWLAQAHSLIFRINDPLASVLFTKTLVAAVRRARAMPGVGQAPRPIDHQWVLVLSGDQNANKGRLVKILAGPFYHSIDVSQLKDKDTRIKAQGSVLAELEEMGATSADREALKRFLSASDDFERAAYERGAEKVQRSYSMIATTNDARLEDPTGHRRFAAIILPRGVRIDIEAGGKLRDAFWSEANALAATSYDHHLTELEQAACEERAGGLEIEDPMVEAVLDACKGRHEVKIREVYDEMTRGLKCDELIPEKEVRRIAGALRKIGCESIRTNVERKWRVPVMISSATPSPEARGYRANLEVSKTALRSN